MLPARSGRHPVTGARPSRPDAADAIAASPSATAAQRADIAAGAFRAIAALLLVCALALRLWGIGQREFWADEYSALLAAFHPQGILEGARGDGANPPLYYLLLRGWAALAGTAEGQVRLPSAIAATGALAALGLFLRELGLSRRAVLWTLLLGTFSPLSVYYAAEARAYAVNLLLVPLLAWSLLRALRGNRAQDWGLHSLVVLFSLYTHTMMASVLAALWAAAAVLRPRPAVWRGLGLSHAAALAGYLPWVPVVISQSQAAGLSWISRWWNLHPPVWHLARTLEIFGQGGPFPDYLPWAPAAWPVRWISLSWSVALLIMVASDLRHEGRADAALPGKPARFLFLLIFAIVPVLVPFGLSLLRAPMYLPGRYEIMAHPAWLGLMGWGAGALELSLRRLGRTASVALPAGAVLLLATLALGPEFRARGGPAERFTRDRIDALARHVAPRDLLVSFDFMYAPLVVEKRLRGFRGRLVTFPRTLAEHPGWVNAEDELRKGEALYREARETAASVGAGGSYDRLWLVPHPENDAAPPPGRPAGPYHQIYSIFLQGAADAGLVTMPPEGVGAEDLERLFLFPLGRPRAAASP